MTQQDALSGKVAGVHRNESGQITHFETIGKNPDGSFAIRQWKPVEGEYRSFGTLDIKEEAEAFRTFENLTNLNLNSQSSRLETNPLLPQPEQEKPQIKDQRPRAKTKDPEKTEKVEKIEIEEPLIISAEGRSEKTEPETESDDPADNNMPELPESNQADRPMAEEPEEEYTGGTFLEDVEHWIPSLFADAHKGVNSLKEELEQDVDEDNWYWKASGASLLDLADTAMSFVEGVPLGLLDTRRLGEGIAKGTVDGALEDASRALNIIPAGRVVRMVDHAITAYHVKKSLEQGDIKTAAMTTGLGAGSFKTKVATDALKRQFPNIKRSPLPKGKKIGTPSTHRTRTAIDSEMDTGDLLETYFPDGGWSPQTRFKNGEVKRGIGRPEKDSTIPDWHNMKHNIAVESKRHTAETNIRDILKQCSGRAISLPPGTKQWLVIDHRGRGLTDSEVVKVHADYFKKVKGNSVFEKIFIVTERGIFEF